MTLRQMKTFNNAIKAAWSAARCAKQLRWPNSWLSLNLCQHRAVVAVALVAPGVAVGQISAPEAAQMSAWVRTTGDHAGQPFAIIDKRNARLFIFDENAVLLGASPVLLGLASGDDSVPGIGERKIADIRPKSERRRQDAFNQNLAVTSPAKILSGSTTTLLSPCIASETAKQLTDDWNG